MIRPIDRQYEEGMTVCKADVLWCRGKKMERITDDRRSNVVQLNVVDVAVESKRDAIENEEDYN